MGILTKRKGAPDPRIIKEGGYQPTSDPGPVPFSLIRDDAVEAAAADDTPPDTLLLKPIDQRLVKALSHELRVEILTILNEREASPHELAKLLGEGLSQVSYHVKVLKDYEVIDKVKTEPRRGAVEHFYRAKSLKRQSDVFEMLAAAEPLPVQDKAGD